MRELIPADALKYLSVGGGGEPGDQGQHEQPWAKESAFHGDSDEDVWEDGFVSCGGSEGKEMELMVEASVKLPHLNTSGRKPVRVGFLSVPTSLPSDQDGSGSVGWPI